MPHDDTAQHDEVEYRHATRDDLPGVGDVFLAAFPESVEHYVGHPISPRVVADFFAICLDAEPAAFFVAVADGRIAGYIFAPTHLSRLAPVAFWHGHLARLFWRWITGQYGIGLHPVFIAIRNWLSFWREAHEDTLRSEARILSIAVHPDFQGRHIATNLMDRGLNYLREQGVRLIRLEVRPENGPAIHVYEKYGFETKGHTRDTQGDWLIMLRTLPEVARG